MANTQSILQAIANLFGAASTWAGKAAANSATAAQTSWNNIPEFPKYDAQEQADRSTFSKSLDLAVDPLRRPYRLAWVAILIAFVCSPMVYHFGNTWNLTILTGSWMLLSTLTILFVALRPTNLTWAAILSGVYAFLMDKDGSQGVAGGPLLLWKVAINAAFANFMVGMVAVAWDFTAVDGGFYAAYLVVLGFFLWKLVATSTAKWYDTITLTILGLCAIGVVWQSFDPDTATGTNWFDNYTGKAVVVGYYSDGDFVVDPLGRTASHCEASSTGCFYKGIRLVTPKVEDAPDTSGYGINTLIDAVTTTGNERQAEIEQDRDDENLNRLIPQSAPALLPAPIILPPPLSISACTNSKYIGSDDCERVMFNTMDAQYARAEKDNTSCVSFDPPSGVRAAEDPENAGVYLFHPVYPGAIVHVYDVAPGQRIAGFRCNPS